jgi:hypothetical protein
MMMMIIIIHHHHVKNEEVLQSIKEERKILHTVKKNEGQLEWSHLAYELPFKTRYGRKDGRKDTSDRKMRKEM